MKILAIGDFHGKFPKKFEAIVEKEKIDLVVSVGDFFPFVYRDLWFKHCYLQEIELWKVIGKKKYQQLIIEDLKLGERAIKKLNNIPVPVYMVVGNLDYAKVQDAYDSESRKNQWKWGEQDFFSAIIKKYKNIHRFDYSYLIYKNFVFVGAYGGTFPGRVKSKNYRKQKKILEKLFKKFKKENENKKLIFVSHNVPYNTKLDKIGTEAHAEAKGKHKGSKLIRRIIEKYQPILHIAGHIHESFGKDKIGKTLCINTGAAHDGRAAIIFLPENKKEKLRIKFIR